MIELNSETDFVARNELFQTLAGRIAQNALSAPPPDASPVCELDVAMLGASALAPAPDASAGEGSLTVESAVGFAVSQLGENLVVRRACLLQPPSDGGLVASYTHNTYSAGVGRTAGAVVLRSSVATGTGGEALRALGEQIAMHVVAASPQYLDRASVPADAVQRERDMLSEQAAASGKPAAVVEKMVAGRLSKWYAEVCLLEQQYLIDDAAGSVANVLAAASDRLGAPVSLEAYARYQVGEGLEANDAAP